MRSNEELVRQYAKQRFGHVRVRVQRTGDVRVHGVMPKSGAVGWYLLGAVLELLPAARAYYGLQPTHGRPRTRGPRGARFDIYLYPEAVGQLRRIGAGNLSRGVRTVLASFVDASGHGPAGSVGTNSSNGGART